MWLMYETKYQDKYKHLDIKQKLHKEEELKRRLVSQQTVFVKAKSQSEAALGQTCGIEHRWSACDMQKR